MKKLGLYLFTSALIVMNTCGIPNKVYASKFKLFQKFKKNKTKQTKQTAQTNQTNETNDTNRTVVTIKNQDEKYSEKQKEKQNTGVASSKIEEKKSNILNLINSLKESSKKTDQAYNPAGNTILGDKPAKLYSLNRLLDYSPHPTTENILKDKPVLYNDKNYYFTVTYNEGWKDISAEKAVLESISFTFDVYENGNKVRNVTTPKVGLSSKKIKKGQVLGIAEIAPFKFNVVLDDITVTSKGISTLIFKLDLIG